MLTQTTAAALHNCHQQIINAEKLLTETRKELKEPLSSKLIDAFGRRSHSLELGVPSASGGHRIFQVDYELAAIIIEAQVEKYKAQLKALNEMALLECSNNDTCSPTTPTP